MTDVVALTTEQHAVLGALTRAYRDGATGEFATSSCVGGFVIAYRDRKNVVVQATVSDFVRLARCELIDLRDGPNCMYGKPTPRGLALGVIASQLSAEGCKRMEDLLTDTITLVKKDGQRFEGIKASVQGNRVFAMASEKHAFEDGDEIQRAVPGGVVESYTITDTGYMQGIGGIRAHYQMKVEKANARPRHSGHVISVSGPNARVNVNSIDASTNTVGAPPRELFENVRSAVRDRLAQEERRDLLERIDALETAHNTPTFLAKYQDFVTAAANHMTVVGPFLPALTKLLGV